MSDNPNNSEGKQKYIANERMQMALLSQFNC